MSRKLKYDFTRSEWSYEEIRQYYYDYFKNIAINQFEWKGEAFELNPQIGLTSELLEDILFENGKAIFFKDSKYGYLALNAIAGTNLNVYYRPTMYTALGNAFSKQISLDDGVLIRNNALMKPTRNGIWYYCGELADIELALKINRNANKTPFIINCTEKTVLSAQNFFKQIHANEPLITKNKSKVSDGDLNIEVLNTGAEFLGAELCDQFNNTVAKILTLLGIENYIEDKKERVQSAEVESNEEYIDRSFASSYEQRQKACDLINDMFNLNITVEYKPQVKPVVDEEPIEEPTEEGDDNE